MIGTEITKDKASCFKENHVLCSGKIVLSIFTSLVLHGDIEMNKMYFHHKELAIL